MKIRYHKLALLLLASVLGCFVLRFAVWAASVSPAVPKAKQQAESRGQIFISSHDEIVEKAKKEGRLRVTTGMLGSVKATTEAFRKKYPFIDLQDAVTIRSADNYRQYFLEIKAGINKDWDVARIDTDDYSEWLSHVWKVDLLGMAEHGILALPPKMIDPRSRSIISVLSSFQVTAYNKNLIPPNQVPKTWEDMLKPEFKGKKFAVDIRSQELAALAPVWGLEKVLEFARKIATQQPIWVRGGTREVVAVASGEIPLFLGPNYSSVKGAQRKDPLKVLQLVLLEPIPTRIRSEHAILARSKNPHAALLWVEWITSPEAQKLIDEHEPLASSFYVQGSAVEQELRGKNLSVVGWEESAKMEQWIPKIVEAFGFPRAETK
jgi:iron(III) transport system substrate-binding protein